MITTDSIPVTLTPLPGEALSEATKGDTQDEAKIRKAAQNFESFFVGYIFDMAYQSIPKSEFSEGVPQDVYQSMFMQKLAEAGSQSKQGFGVAQQIMRQLKARSGQESTPALNADLPSGPVGLDQGACSGLQLPFCKVSSAYGVRSDPFLGVKKFHQGVDLPLPMRTPIQAAGDGTVTFSGLKGGYGQAVEIRHPNGYRTMYAHNDENNVQVGQKIKRGDIIGYSGSTGRSTGPHLHFEVRNDGGEAVDPKKYVSFENKI